MQHLVLCSDYDGTLAHHGELLDRTARALERLRASGRRIVLVTGRRLDDLQSVCGRLDLFDYVVAENGALLYRPATGEECSLAQPPPDHFIETLKARGIDRIAEGRVIVATWEPYETIVLEAIRDLGLELQVIFNKGAVMVLPSGISKATGLAVALERLQIPRESAVGIGDAENDHALLAFCGCSVAVANALQSLKDEADVVTRGSHGDGVIEVIESLIVRDACAPASGSQSR